MNNAMLQKALTKIANQDLALARKQGAITVAQTKLGNLHVEYSAGVYKITAQAGMESMVVCEGKASDARDVLIASYDVVTE